MEALDFKQASLELKSQCTVWAKKNVMTIKRGNDINISRYFNI
jgi:hypothetical protein